MEIVNLQQSQQVIVLIIIGIVIFLILLYMIKKAGNIQEKSELRYEKLVDRLFDTTTKMAARQDESYKEINEQLNNIVTELRLMKAKIEDNTNIIDKELEVRNKFLVFSRETQNNKKRRHL